MQNPLIVSLEEAKELKSKGFNLPTEHYYLDREVPYGSSGLNKLDYGQKLNHNDYDDYIYSAPTKEVALKFLEESK